MVVQPFQGCMQFTVQMPAAWQCKKRWWVLVEGAGPTNHEICNLRGLHRSVIVHNSASRLCHPAGILWCCHCSMMQMLRPFKLESPQDACVMTGKKRWWAMAGVVGRRCFVQPLSVLENLVMTFTRKLHPGAMVG